MTRTERLRRVLQLCCHFSRNHAYLSALRRGQRLRLKSRFWRSAADNFYDLCVLEWCKLFADSKDLHYWANVVTDRPSFEYELRGRIVISAPVFERYSKAMRRYRDKFIAHLDSDRIAQFPNLDIARAAVTIYYEHVVSREAKLATARSFPGNLERYNSECYYEALDVYGRHKPLLKNATR